MIADHMTGIEQFEADLWKVADNLRANSNLARMEMQAELRTWFERIGEFELEDADAVTWVGGQVRGPRSLPVRLGGWRSRLRSRFLPFRPFRRS